MKALKELRNTFKDRNYSSSKLSGITYGTQKHDSTLQPPKMVIRAITDYTPDSPHELSFHIGDFFHVLSDIDLEQHCWIEACNPATNARGYVPISHFDILTRTTPRSTVPLSAQSELNSQVPQRPSSGTDSSVTTLTGSMYGSNGTFATMKFNFEAELPHELSAKEGEGVFIMARSNDEWLVAKPLEHISSPGLIPTSYITFRDIRSGKPLSSEENLSVLSGIPTVYEWGEQNKRYRERSIPLESLGIRSSQDSNSMKPSKSERFSKFLPATPQYYYNMDDYFSSLETYSQQHAFDVPQTQSDPDQNLHMPSTKLTFVSMDYVHTDDMGPWFCLHVFYSCKASSHPELTYKHDELVLYRLYYDFVHLQQALQCEVAQCTPSLTLSITDPTLSPEFGPNIANNCQTLINFFRKLCALPEHLLQASPMRMFLDIRTNDQCRSTMSHFYEPEKFAIKSQFFASHNAEAPSAAGTRGSKSGMSRSSVNTANSSSDVNSISNTISHRVKIMEQGVTPKTMALRMPSTISRASLMNKVEEKFGTKYQALQSATESPSKPFTIKSDEDLRTWLNNSLAHGKKLVLYVIV